MGFPDQLIPAKIKNQRLQPFLPPREKANQGPPRGDKEIRRSTSKPQGQGLQGTPNEEGQPQGREDKKDTRTFEPLMFFYELCEIENNLLILFN